MIEIISGEKGKGKTKHLLERVNKEIETTDGSIVFIDKSRKHMYELDSRIRLINMSDFPIDSSDEFLGFLSGVISQNNDIQEIFLESFLTIGFIDTNEGLCKAIEKLDIISEKFGIKLILSISRNEDVLPECAKSRIVLSL